MKESNYQIMLRLMLQHDFKTFEDMCNRALAKSQITVSEYDDLIDKKRKEQNDGFNFTTHPKN
jgi:hypothetical protein